MCFSSCFPSFSSQRPRDPNSVNSQISDVYSQGQDRLIIRDLINIFRPGISGRFRKERFSELFKDKSLETKKRLFSLLMRKHSDSCLDVDEISAANALLREISRDIKHNQKNSGDTSQNVVDRIRHAVLQLALESKTQTINLKEFEHRIICFAFFETLDIFDKSDADKKDVANPTSTDKGVNRRLKADSLLEQDVVEMMKASVISARLTNKLAMLDNEIRVWRSVDSYFS